MKIVFDLGNGNSIQASPESLSLQAGQTGINLVFAGITLLNFKGKLEELDKTEEIQEPGPQPLSPI